ncbi:MAG: TlpA disulfide reductase family protein [Rhodospirillaceae bacterium]
MSGDKPGRVGKDGTAAGQAGGGGCVTMPLLRAIAMALLPLALIAALVFPPGTAASALRGYLMVAPPLVPPPLAFSDGDGQPASLRDFAGTVVLLTLWATWCGPCVGELPALDRLQARLGGADFQVVAVSVDRGGRAVVAPFLARIGAGHLPLYLDPSSRILRLLGVDALPTSLLLDREGRIVGRIEGDPGWASPEALGLIEGAIGQRRAPRPAGGGLIRTSG